MEMREMEATESLKGSRSEPTLFRSGNHLKLGPCKSNSPENVISPFDSPTHDPFSRCHSPTHQRLPALQLPLSWISHVSQCSSGIQPAPKTRDASRQSRQGVCLRGMVSALLECWGNSTVYFRRRLLRPIFVLEMASLVRSVWT